MGLNLKALISKLNDPTRSALEGAAGLCLSRTHYDIEIEHFLTKLLDSSSGDFAAILKHFEVDKSRLTARASSPTEHSQLRRRSTIRRRASFESALWIRAWRLKSSRVLIFGAQHFISPVFGKLAK